MGKLEDMVKAAYIEFEKDPMDKYYSLPVVSIMPKLRVKKILEELGDINRKIVLDVGCEAGYVSNRIVKKGAHVVAVDICKPALVAFKQRVGGSEKKNIYGPIVASAHRIPLKSGCIDFIVCSEVIEHIPYTRQLLKELARVIKKGGKLVLTFPNEKMREKVYPIVKFFGIDTDAERRVNLFSYSLKDIEKLCRLFYSVEKVYSIPAHFSLTNIIVARK